MTTGLKRKKPQTPQKAPKGKTAGPKTAFSAEESGRIIMALEAADRKETSINLRVSKAKKEEIKELAMLMGVSSAHILLTAFFEYKNRLFNVESVTAKKPKS